MLQMSKPRRARQGEDPTKLYRFDDAARLRRLASYNIEDVEVLRDVDERLLKLSQSEQAIWVLNSRINSRGFRIARPLAEAARRIAAAAAPEIDAELAELTGGTVIGINQVARLLQWVQAAWLRGKSLDRKAIGRLLEKEQDLDPAVRRVLELRLGGAQAAVKKIDALFVRAGEDDRVRGAFRYHGAGTGRWAGEGFQPQNLKRPIVEDIDAAISAISTGDYAHVKERYERPLSVVGDCSRSMICAAPGHVLIGGDFSAVESRVLAWLAGEQWKLDAYTRYDATHDPSDEPYRVTAGTILHKPPAAVTKEERSVGKICDLSFWLHGRPQRWRKFEPDKFTDDEVVRFKNEWRAAHPEDPKFWYDIDRAAWTAVRERGRLFAAAGCVQVHRRIAAAETAERPQDCIPLPSHYWRRARAARGVRRQRGRPFKDCRNGQGAYGGIWVENVVSGIARDVLAEAMQRVEAAVPDHFARARRDRCRGADRFRQHRRIHPPYDTSAQLGARSADRSECLVRVALHERRLMFMPADTRAG